MKKLSVIGIGAGDPDYLTMQAVKALNRVDVFFLMDKGPAKHTLLTCGARSARATSMIALIGLSKLVVLSVNAAIRTTPAASKT